MLRALSIMLTLAASVHAGQWLGLGVMAGEPTGLSAKTWLGKTTAVDAGLAWSLSGDKDLQAHADYLIHNSELLDGLGLPGKTLFYYGLGGRLRLREGAGDDGKDKLGLRIPLGVSWTPKAVSVDVFLEVVPVVDLLPDTEAAANGALGVRFWLK
jgi:hypothetical protein